MGALSTADRSATAAEAAEPLEQRVVGAMLDCIGRWGLGKTTADDVARAAGVSRATVYRAFPGGMDVIFDAVVRHETARFFAAVTGPLDEATALEDRLTVGIVSAARFLDDHQALGYVIAHEPERIVPALSFDRLERTLAVAAAFTTPFVRPFVADDDTAARRAEWLVRILLSYATNPSPSLPLTDEASVRRFVTTYLIPAFSAPPNS